MVAKLIAVARNVLETLGVPFVIENVLGARKEMISPIEVHGQMFGLHTDRARLLEAGGGWKKASTASFAAPVRGAMLPLPVCTLNASGPHRGYVFTLWVHTLLVLSRRYISCSLLSFYPVHLGSPTLG